MTYHMNDWQDWDEYYHEDNFLPNKEMYRYIRQTQDGRWWYSFTRTCDLMDDPPWTEIPEAQSLEEAAAAADMIWRMR